MFPTPQTTPANDVQPAQAGNVSAPRPVISNAASNAAKVGKVVNGHVLEQRAEDGLYDLQGVESEVPASNVVEVVGTPESAVAGAGAASAGAGAAASAFGGLGVLGGIGGLAGVGALAAAAGGGGAAGSAASSAATSGASTATTGATAGAGAASAGAVGSEEIGRAHV